MFPINFKVVSDVVLSNSPVIPWLEVPVITFIVIAFVYVRVIRNKFASDEFTVPINIADWYISNGNLTELPKTYSLFLLLFNLQSCNFEGKITCRISDKTNGPILSSFCSTYSTSYSIRTPHSIFWPDWDDNVFRNTNLQIVYLFFGSRSDGSC